MAYEEFERRLTEYGLEPKEAKVYVVLAWGGPMKAGELAKVCGQSRIDTYRVLRRLQSKGLVETILLKPMRFAAVPPDKAFDILIRTVKERIRLLEEEKKDFLKLWASVPKAPLEAEEERFRIIWGRVEFFSAVKQMCAAASKRIYILTTRNGLSRLYYAGVDHQVEEKKGVEVRVLAEIDRSNLEAAERFASIATLHYSKPTSTQFVLADDSEIIVNMALDDSMSLSSEKDTSLWTNSKGYVGLMQRLFDELWADSVDARSAMQFIVSGERLPETMMIRDEEKILEKEAEMIQSARSKVMILTPSLRVKRLLKEPLASELKACGERGVSIRIMTNLDEEINDLLSISQSYNLRLVDFKTNAETVAVDDVKTMLISLNGGQALITGELAFWTSEKSYAVLMRNFLEQVWSNGRDPHPYFLSISVTNELNSALAQIAEELSSQGWVVHTPGTINGSSSVKHTFKLVVTKQGRVITIDYLVGAAPIGAEHLIPYGARKADAMPSRAILLVVPGADEQAVKLAEFFGVELFQDTDVARLLARVRETLGLSQNR